VPYSVRSTGLDGTEAADSSLNHAGQGFPPAPPIKRAIN
jgi:hypothetical protein